MRAAGAGDGGDEPGAAREGEGEAREADREPGVVDRADDDPDHGPAGRGAHDPDTPVICEVCGGAMEYTASCKLVCRNCGYMRDCSDP